MGAPAPSSVLSPPSSPKWVLFVFNWLVVRGEETEVRLPEAIAT